MGQVFTKKISLDSQDVFTHSVPLGDDCIRTKRFDMGLPPTLKSVVHTVQPQAVCIRPPLMSEKLATQWISTGKPKVECKPSKRTELPNVNMSVRRVRFDFGRTGLKSKKIVFESWHRVNTFRWNQIRNMAATRDAVNTARLPYPLISDYVVALAEKAKTRYTDVQILGIFDHIPLHYASGLTIDSVIGRLWFHFLDKPRGDKRFVRVVYGKIRSSGEMVQVYYPLK
jgi:hypothetical protein